MQVGDKVVLINSESGKMAMVTRTSNAGDKAIILRGSGDQQYAISASGSAAVGDKVVVSSSHLTGEKRAWFVGVGSDNIKPVDFVDADGTIRVNGIKCIPIYQNPQASDTVVLMRSQFGPWIAYKPGAAPCEVRFRPNVTVLRAAQPVAGAAAVVDLAVAGGRVATPQVHALMAADEVCAFGFYSVKRSADGLAALSSNVNTVTAVSADNYLLARTIEGTLGYGGQNIPYSGIPIITNLLAAGAYTYLMVECRNLNSGTGTVGVSDIFVIAGAEAQMVWEQEAWRDGRTKWFGAATLYGEGIMFEAGEYEVYTKGWWSPWELGYTWNYTGDYPPVGEGNYLYPSYCGTPTNLLNLVVQEGDVGDEVSFMSLIDTTTRAAENSEGWGTFILARPAKVGIRLIDDPYADNRGSAIFRIRKIA
jgi:hypothetical protein